MLTTNDVVSFEQLGPICLLTAEFEKKTQAFQMRYHPPLLNISYKNHITKKDVPRKIQAANG